MNALSALKVTVWGQMFAVISMTRSVWIICENKNKYVKYYVAIGTTVNLVVNFILIPIMGIVGAAIATLLTNMVVLIFAPLLFRETRQQIPYLIHGFLITWAWKRTK